MKAALLLVVVGLTHYGYAAYGDPQEQSWLFYIFRGVEGAVLFWLLLDYVREAVLVWICWVGMIEEGATAVCGALSYKEIDYGSSLCLDQVGVLPFAAAAAFIIVWGKHHAARKG